MPCQINNTSNFDITEIEDLIQDLFSFSQDRLGFKKNPCLNLVSDKNNISPLGKTAYYDPSGMEITIYVDDRHPKDIMRSFSHELVHHNQNENGMFDQMNNTGTRYAQSDPHLRKMEKEAYLKGNMCFRDWEDGYKSSNPNILNERRIYKMSTKKWKDNELNGLLNEKWGFSMNLNKLNEGKKKPDADGDGVPDWADKKSGKDDHTGEEKIEEIDMGVRGGLGKTPKSETDSALKASPFTKKSEKKSNQKKEKSTIMKEGEDMQSEMSEMIRNSDDDASELASKIIAKFFDSKRPPEAPPTSSSDNGSSGAPAQPSLQEKKLRNTIRKIIKSKFNKRK
jgi:hypothetical protein